MDKDNNTDQSAGLADTFNKSEPDIVHEIEFAALFLEEYRNQTPAELSQYFGEETFGELVAPGNGGAKERVMAQMPWRGKDERAMARAARNFTDEVKGICKRFDRAPDRIGYDYARGEALLGAARRAGIETRFANLENSLNILRSTGFKEYFIADSLSRLKEHDKIKDHPRFKEIIDHGSTQTLAAHLAASAESRFYNPGVVGVFKSVDDARERKALIAEAFKAPDATAEVAEPAERIEAERPALGPDDNVYDTPEFEQWAGRYEPEQSAPEEQAESEAEREAAPESPRRAFTAFGPAAGQGRGGPGGRGI